MKMNYKKNAKILEIGAADGKASKYLERLGYDVTASDVAHDFRTALLKENLKTIKLNVLKDNIDSKYDGVLCWRVFVHFTKEDSLNANVTIYDKPSISNS